MTTKDSLWPLTHLKGRAIFCPTRRCSGTSSSRRRSRCSALTVICPSTRPSWSRPSYSSAASARPPTWCPRRCSRPFPARTCAAGWKRGRPRRRKAACRCAPRARPAWCAPWFSTIWCPKGRRRQSSCTRARCFAPSVRRRAASASSTRWAWSAWVPRSPPSTPRPSSCSCASTRRWAFRASPCACC